LADVSAGYQPAAKPAAIRLALRPRAGNRHAGHQRRDPRRPVSITATQQRPLKLIARIAASACSLAGGGDAG
jgi:hypothetical protein